MKFLFIFVYIFILVKILVTGGAGFIGFHLRKKLLEIGHKITIVDNLSNGNMQNVYELHGITFNECDVTSRCFVNICRVGEFNAVFHLAANSDIANPDPKIDMRNTFRTTYQVLKCCREFNIKQLIFPSTSAIFGDIKKTIDENIGPLQPLSHYGSAKLASEAWISSYSYQYGIQSWICRFPNVTGSNSTHGIVHDFKKKLLQSDVLEVLGDGNQCKPYIYVDDLVSAILFIWRNAKDRLNVYNIGSPDTITVREIAEMMSKKIRYTGQSWIGDVSHYDYDCSKLTQLGWVNIRSSKEAIRLSI